MQCHWKESNCTFFDQAQLNEMFGSLNLKHRFVMYGVSGQSFCGTPAVESCVLYLKLDSKQIIKDKMEKKKK